MEKLVLKPEIVEKIQNDPDLFGKVADILNVKPVTLPRILYDNSERLTIASVLRLLREYLGVKQDAELLTDEILTDIK